MHELSLAAGVLPEHPPETVAEAAGRAGYRLSGFTVDPQQWSDATTARVRARLAQWDLAVLDVEVVWIPAGGRLDDSHRRIVEIGGELGARNVLVVSSEADPARVAEALRRLCEWAEPFAMRVALEFLMITPIRSLAQARTIVDACDHPAAAVLVDTLHLARAGNTPDDVAALPADLRPYVQFCDAPATCGDSHQAYLEDALDRRSAPGEGDLPLAALLTHLPADCPLSLEVRSRAYREAYPDPTERAAAIRQRTLQFLDSLAS